MGLLDTVLGGLFGGGASSSPLQSILGQLLANAGGPGGLLDKLRQSGYGDRVDSWVGPGQNAPIHPGELRDALGQHQVDSWAQQTGMGQDDILHQLSQMIPHAVDGMTPASGGEAPDDSHVFDGPGR